MSAIMLLKTGPFRLFFPLGVLCGVIGVGHWALWSVGWVETSSGFLHALIQTQGFLGCVAIGFMMTFLPRVIGVKEPSLTEVLLAFLFALGFPIGYLIQSYVVIEVSFLLVLAVLIVFGARRLPHRPKQHPRSLILLDVGLLHALIGTVLILIGGDVLFIGRQMVQLGFLLCLVLAMTGFLMPFLTGYNDEDKNKLSIAPAHAITGLLILLTFVFEPAFPAVAAYARAMAVTTHLFLFARIQRPSLKKAVYVRLFRFSAWMIPLGLWAAALFPLYRVAAYHIIFIGGFSLMIFSFGTLVVLSHSAHAALLNKPMKILWVIGGSTLFAMLLRVSADIAPAHYFSLIHTASGLWLLAALLWAGFISTKLWFNPFPSP